MSILHSAVSAFTSRKAPERRCPKCGAIQKVAAAHQRDAVTCKTCGHTIPAPARS